ncbi:UNVERIFIED_CONTAM: hypothetical protein HDU68_006855 [Siphonaria sp. JEL0065]|nr:hypothetical protein HDU68_006849 [Siphonaria sp. JEL0065]KAJ3032082.1 hypothetical protein HDU68_006855 [Siphonaria sp. JEL0065]
MDVNEFRKRGHEAVERIAKYYEDLAAAGTSNGSSSDVPTITPLSTVEPGFLGKLIPAEAPELPEKWEDIQSDIESKIMPGITHWQHPSFFSFFPANSSFPGILGEMYSSMFNAIGFNWQTSPSYTELETIMMDWVAKAIGLDNGFLSNGEGGGVIQGSASEAICVAIIAARQRMVDFLSGGLSEEEAHCVTSKFIAYGSTQTHSSTKKGCTIANVRFRALEVDPVTFSLQGTTVAAAIKTDIEAGLIPIYVTATIGTTSSGATDDIPGIVAAAAPHNVWVNIDAAWAGAACVCPEYQHVLAGTDKADSFSFNMHKWLLTNFDCSPMWVRNRKHLTNALSITPVYLRNAASSSGFVNDYRDWQLPLGRRFRALKVWFVIRTYGLEGLRSHIRKHIEQCKRMQTHLETRPDRYKIITGPNWSLITFQVLPPSGSEISANELTNKLYDAINADGEIFLTHSILNDTDVIRFVPGSQLTQDSHIDGAFVVFERITDIVLGSL